MSVGPYLTEVSLDQLVSKLNPKIDASRVTVEKTRVDAVNNRIHFAATSGGDVYEVTIKINRKGKKLLGKPLAEADVKTACTCPAFLYQGADYHAKNSGYLDTRKKYPTDRSKDRAPLVRDPKGNNLICKHILAVYEQYQDLIV